MDIILYLMTYGVLNTVLVGSGFRLAAYASDVHISWLSCCILGFMFSVGRATQRVWHVKQVATLQANILNNIRSNRG